MASRNPDFAALSEAAYEAADKLLEHFKFCGNCKCSYACHSKMSLIIDYQDKKDKALQAIRGKTK